MFRHRSVYFCGANSVKIIQLKSIIHCSLKIRLNCISAAFEGIELTWYVGCQK